MTDLLTDPFIAELRALRESAVKFEERFIPEPNSGCFLWVGVYDKDGYGRFKFHQKWMRAHRFSWELNGGPIPTGMHVCHKCDTRACVNPKHLFLGTNADNTADKTKKNRVPYGERHCHARLTEIDVLNIRADKRRQRVIARAFGISRTHVQRIKSGLKWRRLPNSPVPASPSRDALQALPLCHAGAGDPSTLGATQ
jgi:hypothetical protein